MTGAFHGRSFFAQNADFSVNLLKWRGTVQILHGGMTGAGSFLILNRVAYDESDAAKSKNAVHVLRTYFAKGKKRRSLLLFQTALV